MRNKKKLLQLVEHGTYDVVSEVMLYKENITKLSGDTEVRRGGFTTTIAHWLDDVVGLPDLPNFFLRVVTEEVPCLILNGRKTITIKKYGE